jgi:release factor glutamine methyltransferase
VGEYLFRGKRLQVETGCDVLFPTDVGVSLLTALNGDPGFAVSGVQALDVGCGCGLYTVALLLAGAATVTALDVNPACTAATLDNAACNGLDGQLVKPVTGDLAGLEGPPRWDLVVCNPPHLPDDPAYAAADGLQAALVGGADGRALYDVLLARLHDLLRPGGTLLLAHSSLADIPRTCAELTAAGYGVRTLQVCELDIPLRRYAACRDTLLARLYQLRAAGSASFTGLRFEVHVLAATRPSSKDTPSSKETRDEQDQR